MGNTKLKHTPLTGILGLCLLFCLLFTNFFGLYSKEIRADKIYSLVITEVDGGNLILTAGRALEELTYNGEDIPRYYEFQSYEEVQFIPEPDEGYYLDRIDFYDVTTDEQILDLDVYKMDGTYAFKMPALDIYMTPVFLPDTDTAEYKESRTKTVRDNSTTKYILDNLDESYAKPEKIEPYDFMLIKQTLMDESIARPDGDLDEMFSTTEENSFYYLNAIIRQHDSYALLYDTSDDSDYAVALINPNIRDKEINTKRAYFAKANYNGEEIEEAVYDSSTGLAYIPKEILRPDGTYLTTQAQLVQYIKDIDAETSVDVDIFVSGYDGIVTSGKATTNAFTDSLKIIITEDEKAKEELTVDDITVSADGMEEFIVEDIEYDASRGELTIPLAPLAIRSVQIDIKKPGFWESLLKGAQNVGEGIVNWFKEAFTGTTVKAGTWEGVPTMGNWTLENPETLEQKMQTEGHVGVDQSSCGATLMAGYIGSGWKSATGTNHENYGSSSQFYTGGGATFFNAVANATGAPNVAGTVPIGQMGPGGLSPFGLAIYDRDIVIEGCTFKGSCMSSNPHGEIGPQLDISANHIQAQDAYWASDMVYHTPGHFALGCAHATSPLGDDLSRIVLRVVKYERNGNSGTFWLGIVTGRNATQTGNGLVKVNFTSEDGDTPKGDFYSDATITSPAWGKSKSFTEEEYASWDKTFTITDTYKFKVTQPGQYAVRAYLYKGTELIAPTDGVKSDVITVTDTQQEYPAEVRFTVTGVDLAENSTARYNIRAELKDANGNVVAEDNKELNKDNQRVEITRGDAPPPEPVEEDHEEVDVHIDVEGEFAWEEEYHYPAEVKLYKSSLTTGNEYFDRLIADSFNYTGMTFGVYTDPACTQPAKQQIGPYLVRVDETANHETETTTTTTTRWKTLDGVEVPGSRSETVVGPETTYDGPSRRIPADYDAAVAQIDPDGDTPGTGNGDIATFTTTTVDDYMGESNTVSLKAYGGATYYIKETNVNEAITGHVAPAQPVWEVTIENNQVKINIGSLEYAECSHGEHESYTNFSYEEGEIQGQAPDIFSIGGPGTNGGVDNIPSYNPFGLLIQKADDERQFDLVGTDNALFTATGSTNNAPRPQGNGSLAGAVFKLDLEMKLWRNGAMAHKATFYLQTDAKGQILLHPNYQAENYPEPDCEGGWNTFYIDGGYYLPTTISDLVKATVTEVRAPEGYNLPVKRTWGPFVVWKDDPSAPAATTQSYLKGLNETLRNDFRDISYDIYF